MKTKQELDAYLKNFYPVDEYDVNLTLQDLIALTEDYDGLALIAGDRQFTHKEVHAAADKIALVLAHRGIGRGDIVAILIDKDERLIMAITGVLKASAAYLIISKGWPEKRQKFVLADSKAVFTITEENYDLLVGEGEKIMLGDKLPVIEKARPKDPCVLQYTSGTTGNPKGIAASHANIVNIVLPLKGNDAVIEIHKTCHVLLSLVNYIFCPSNLEYGLWLLMGCPLVLIPEYEVLSAEKIAGQMRKHQTDFVSTVPTLLASLLENAKFREEAGHLKIVQLAGEKIPRTLAETIYSISAGNCKVQNNYGMTETQGVAMGTFPAGSENVNLLKPQSGVYMQILNEAGTPQPIGEIGELCISGRRVAEGYTDPKINATHFGKDPKGRNLFRSGDAAYMDKAGNIEIVGRIDRMVKINGIRIELPEIEANMEKCPGVSRAAAKALEIDGGSSGEKILCGYYVTDSAVSEEKLRQYMESVLPIYMVPRFIMRLAEMPFTERGKIDYRRLPAPVTDSEDHGAGGRNEAEIAVAAAFAETFGLNHVGINTDFYAVGGDSLDALKLILAIEKRGFSVGARDIFNGRTVAEIAAHSVATAIDVTDEPPGLRYVPREDYESVAQVIGDMAKAEAVLPLTYMQGLYFVQSYADKLANKFFIDRLYIVKMPEAKERLGERLEKMKNRHPAMRSIFKEVAKGRNYQIILREKEIPVSFSDLRGENSAGELSTRRQEKIIWENYRNSWEKRAACVNENPLMLDCYQLSEDTAAVLLKTTHLLFDGWSLAIFEAELFGEEEISGNDGFYRTYDYVRERSKRSPETMRYWKERLDQIKIRTMPLTGALPDKPEPLRREIEISGKRLARLHAHCDQQNVSLETLLNFLYGKALMEYYHDSSAVLDLVCANRPAEVPYSHASLGMFFNAVVRAITAADSLAAFKKNTAGDMEHGATPIEEIWEAALGHKTFLSIYRGIDPLVFPYKLPDRVLKEIDMRADDIETGVLLYSFDDRVSIVQKTLPLHAPSLNRIFDLFLAKLDGLLQTGSAPHE